jgi:hypothetical protein
VRCPEKLNVYNPQTRQCWMFGLSESVLHHANYIPTYQKESAGAWVVKGHYKRLGTRVSGKRRLIWIELFTSYAEVSNVKRK